MSSGFTRILLALLLGSCAVAQAQVYKWTDADGTVHYTDAPPPNIQTQPVPNRLSTVPLEQPSSETVEAMQSRIEERDKAEEARVAPPAVAPAGPVVTDSATGTAPGAYLPYNPGMTPGENIRRDDLGEPIIRRPNEGPPVRRPLGR